MKTNINVNKQNNDVLNTINQDTPPPFALICRNQHKENASVECLIGSSNTLKSLDDIVLPDVNNSKSEATHDTLLLLPYQQISSRGFDAIDDGTPLISINIEQQQQHPKDTVIGRLPSLPIQVKDSGFDIDDDSYKSIVQDILDKEISKGKGASFVIRRSYSANLNKYKISTALSIYKKLLAQESGAYWTFIVYTGERVLIGATPERHISLDDGIATMNPISGTYIYPPSGSNLSGTTSFLNNKKEKDELYIVVDEELKMMCSACDNSVWLDGPYLKEMARVSHTEYLIHGRPTKGPIDLLKETMFAPTVMGGPIESAARVISEYEPEGRGYYSGVMALISQKNNARVMDSGILIRTADINSKGKLNISAGASLVRDSNPSDEAIETRGKIAGLLSALGITSKPKLSKHPDVIKLLNDRNTLISNFWLTDQSCKTPCVSSLLGKRVLIIDAEDMFTSMIEHQLRSIGCETKIIRFDDKFSLDQLYDIVVMGPGPGDPQDKNCHKIAHLYRITKELLARRQPFLSVCLSHQVLSSILGLKLVQRDSPNQGVQKEINLFGQYERVGFYNSFSAHNHSDRAKLPNGNDTVELSRDPVTGEIHAMRSEHFYSMQFHAESLLTIDGVRIFEEALTHLCSSTLSFDINSSMIGQKHKKTHSHIKTMELG